MGVLLGDLPSQGHRGAAQCPRDRVSMSTIALSV